MTFYKVRKVPSGHVIVRTVESIGKLTRTEVVKFPSRGSLFTVKANAVIVCYWLNN